jgi:hypothetical protein
MVRSSFIQEPMHKTLTYFQVYPSQLLIYNAGTAKTFGVAAIKVTTVIAFLANVYTFAVPHFWAHALPDWIEAARSGSNLRQNLKNEI